MSAPAAAGAVDVLIVSLGSTTGLRAADEELAASLRRAGASVAVAAAAPPRPRAHADAHRSRLGRAAARAAAAAALRARPAAVDRLLDARPPRCCGRAGRDPLRRARRRQPARPPRPLAAPARAPAPGEAHRCCCRGARAALAEAGLGAAASRPRSLSCRCRSSPPGEPAPERDIAAITYAGNPAQEGPRPRARGLARRRGRAAGEGAELVVAGASAEELRGAGIDRRREPGVRDAGRLPAAEYRALLRRARVFVTAPRREDYGHAQLEALADGCLLVTHAGAGPVRGAADRPAAGCAAWSARTSGRRCRGRSARPDRERYAARALAELAPLRTRRSSTRGSADELLPRLLGGARRPALAA